MMEKLKNRFLFSEWSVSIGDLRTLLPLAVALAVGFISFATPDDRTGSRIDIRVKAINFI